MEIGMMWFDNKRKPFSEIIEEASEHFKQKYGLEANLCLINPSGMPTDEEGNFLHEERIGNIKIRSSSSVMPNNYWLGVE